MINSIQNGDQPLPVIAQLSLAGNAQNAPPTLKYPKKAAILYEYETFKAIEGEKLLDTYLRYLQVINDLKKCGYKRDNCDVNDALGYNKKAVVVTSDPLALVAEKTKMLLAKKDKDEQVLLAEDQASMESSSDSDQEINANMVIMAQNEKFLSNSEASSSSVVEIKYNFIDR
nr:hypothetical protein [Tanacetum cinerariifolium]